MSYTIRDTQPAQPPPPKITLRLRQTQEKLPAKPRCQPDLHDSKTICTSHGLNDDRQIVSHFFGRNKRHTATIPKEYFPVLCRVHYQERTYRWRQEPGLMARYQCECILKVLERMSKKKFVDENGNGWPWWSGFRLQLATLEASSPSKATGENAPSWLTKICAPATISESDQDPDPVRFDFEQTSQIVKALGTWCYETNQALPTIEALPVTLAIHNEKVVRRARSVFAAADRTRQIAYEEMQQLRIDGKADMRLVQEALSKHAAADKEVKDAHRRIELAKMDLAACAVTKPPKRAIKQRKCVDVGLDDVDTVDNGLHQPSKKRCLTTAAPVANKRRKQDS